MEVITRKRAKLLGLPKYYTGKPCKYGHIAERAVANWGCLECQNQWRADNPEKIKYYRRNANNTNKEWRKAHPDKVKLWAKRYAEANRDKANLRSRKYSKTEKGIARTRKYNKSEKGLIKQHRERQIRRARMKGATLNLYSYRDKLNLHRIFKGRCAYCGVGGPLTDDHFVPIAKGGLHSIENIIPSCLSCNCSKNDSNPLEWFKKHPQFTKYKLLKILRVLGTTETKMWSALTN